MDASSSAANRESAEGGLRVAPGLQQLKRRGPYETLTVACVATAPTPGSRPRHRCPDREVVRLHRHSQSPALSIESNNRIGHRGREASWNLAGQSLGM